MPKGWSWSSIRSTGATTCSTFTSTCRSDSRPPRRVADDSDRGGRERPQTLYAMAKVQRGAGDEDQSADRREIGAARIKVQPIELGCAEVAIEQQPDAGEIAGRIRHVDQE